MEAKTEQLIKTLTQMKGTSGHEGRIRDFMRSELTPLFLGFVIAKKKMHHAL